MERPVNAQTHPYSAIDPTSEVEAILDFAEAGYPEEVRILTTALCTSASVAMCCEHTRKRAIAAYRDGDYEAIGRLVVALVEDRLRQVALERLGEPWEGVA